MTPTEITIRQLRAAIAKCLPTGFCTLRVKTIEQAIELLEKQPTQTPNVVLRSIRKNVVASTEPPEFCAIQPGDREASTE